MQVRFKPKSTVRFTPKTETPAVDPNDAIRQQQAAKYPTSAEQGGTPGQAQQAGLGWQAVGRAIDPLVSPETIETAIRYAPNPMRPHPAIQTPPELNPTGKAGAEMIAGMTSPVELAMGPALGKASSAIKAGAADNLVLRAKQALSTEKGMQRSLAPTTLPMKGQAQAIAPELAKRGEIALTKRRFDANMVQKAKNAGEAVKAAEDAVPHGTTLQRQPILEKLQGAVEELQIPGQGDELISGHPDAIQSLTNLYNDIAKLPEQIPFKDLIKYRRQLDAAIDQVSGFSETASAADKAAMLARKKAVGIIREQLNNASADLAKANKDFSLYQRAREIVERRELGKVGQPGIIKKSAPYLIGGAAGGAGSALWNILSE